MNREEILYNKLSSYQIDLSLEQIEKLICFYDIVIEKNKMMNLTSITDYEEFVVKHILDSLSLQMIKNNLLEVGIDLDKRQRIIDVGSGAGFPGIPIKIAFGSNEILLLDSLKKRINFLTETIKSLGLKDITAIHHRAEDAARINDYRESFDLGLARAVSNLSVLCEYVLPFIKVGGCFVAYKGKISTDEISNSEKAISLLGGKLFHVKHFYLDSNSEDRALIIIEKTSNTPTKYPRKAGLPVKKPII